MPCCLRYRDLRHDPLEVRKATLASIVAKASPGIRFNEHIKGDGPTVFAHACKLGLDGGSPERFDITPLRAATATVTSKTRALVVCALAPSPAMRLAGRACLRARP
jgi:hypothetical protein